MILALFFSRSVVSHYETVTILAVLQWLAQDKRRNYGLADGAPDHATFCVYFVIMNLWERWAGRITRCLWRAADYNGDSCFRAAGLSATYESPIQQIKKLVGRGATGCLCAAFCRALRRRFLWCLPGFMHGREVRFSGAMRFAGLYLVN